MLHKFFINQYFNAANSRNIEEILQHYSEGAVVYDEGIEYRGLDKIRCWLENTNEKHSMHYTILNISFADDKATVVASVAGTFPGSPMQQMFSFIIQDYKIISLKCEA